MAHEIGFKNLFSNTFEKTTFNKLETWFRKDGAKVLHNCALPWKTGGITEADVIMIGRCGIYVIECKRWHGVITNECGKYHKYIPHDDREDYDEDCENPFWQNHLHIKCLKELLKRELGIENLPIFSMAVFPDECSIENIEPKYKGDYPVHLKASMIQTIKKIDGTHRRTLSNRGICEIYDILKPLEPSTKEERLENVRKIRHQRNISFERRRCG